MRDNRRRAPATTRNREPILAILRDVLPERGTVLEIASGTGEHAIYFARGLPGVVWQPSDPDFDALSSIRAWAEAERPDNVRPPVLLDVTMEAWPVISADAVVCINMIHIAPWEATLALMAGTRRLLAAGAPLVLYGPYRRTGHSLEPSNEAFDADLKARNPRWGLRLLEDVADVGAKNGLMLERVVEMPANNLCLIFRRSTD